MKLNEEQAWKVIELIFRRPKYICITIERLLERGLVTRTVYAQLAERMQRQRPVGANRFSSYWWSVVDAEPDNARMLFAEQQAKRVHQKKRRGTT